MKNKNKIFEKHNEKSTDLSVNFCFGANFCDKWIGNGCKNKAYDKGHEPYQGVFKE